MSSSKTGNSNTDNNQEYFSIEAPHKPRRQSYFWTIVVTLAILAGAVGVTLSNTSFRAPPPTTTMSDASSPATSNNNNNNNLEPLAPSSSTKSYHVDLNKQTWPELVGLDATVAKDTIQGENPSITRVQILPADSFVTMDYSTTRVRIFVNDENVVQSVPRVG